MRYIAGIAVKKYLKGKGISQVFVSQKTGIPQNKLNNRLNGKSELKANELFLIADRLDIALEEIRQLARQITD